MIVIISTKTDNDTKKDTDKDKKKAALANKFVSKSRVERAKALEDAKKKK